VTEAVAEIIRRAIEDHGPITFAEFMDMALYGPGGFYQEPPVGEGGHFVTSPHVHPVFGKLLASGLAAMWEALDRPDPFDVVEIGAGDGTLAEQLLDAFSGVPVRYTAVERSAGSRARLGRLPVRVAAAIEDLEPGLTGCVLANELLDNLPFHRIRRNNRGLVEVRVGLVDDRLVEVEVACPPHLEAAGQVLRPGQEAAVSLEALSLVRRITAALSGGYVLLIDYGHASGRPAGPVHGYRAHRVVGEVLDEPGSADITAGVDFRAAAAEAKRCGLTVLGPTTQSKALEALGYRRWSEEERDRQGELLRTGGGTEAVRTWAARSRASLLVDPAGLGRLQWLALATSGLAWPAWLEEAARA
jgi:SAM-dependent MidA family methyltransferase